MIRESEFWPDRTLVLTAKTIYLAEACAPMFDKTIKIISEDLELYSPITGLPAFVDGEPNIEDKSLAFVYIEEIEEFMYINKALNLEYPPLDESTCQDISVVFELDDTIPGGNILVGYVQ